MKFSFKANIYKVGIHPCMYVPLHTAAAITAQKGYIPVSRKIDNQSFLQTLLPVKNNTYRLYMNGAMLKGSGLQVGDTASFTTEQKLVPAEFPIPAALKKQLTANNLLTAFKKLTAYWQKKY